MTLGPENRLSLRSSDGRRRELVVPDRTAHGVKVQYLEFLSVLSSFKPPDNREIRGCP
jgi:hypothetical protein